MSMCMNGDMGEFAKQSKELKTTIKNDNPINGIFLEESTSLEGKIENEDNTTDDDSSSKSESRLETDPNQPVNGIALDQRGDTASQSNVSINPYFEEEDWGTSAIELEGNEFSDADCDLFPSIQTPRDINNLHYYRKSADEFCPSDLHPLATRTRYCRSLRMERHRNRKIEDGQFDDA